MGNSGLGLNMVERVYDPIELINIAVAFAILLAGFLALFNVFKWWFQFILSAGDEWKVREAINWIRYALIWLVITFLSFVVVAWVWNIFWYNLLDYISLNKIMEIVNTVTSSSATKL